MSLGVLRRPTLVTIVVVVSSYGGLKGLLWFFGCMSIIELVERWLAGGHWFDSLRLVFLCGDVTSGLPDDVIIDAHTDRSGTDGHFRVTSDVMGHDVTSG